MQVSSDRRDDFIYHIYIVLLVRLFLGLVFFGLSFYLFWKSKIRITDPQIRPFYIFSLLLLVFTIAGAATLRRFYNKAITAYAACQIGFDVFAVSVFVCLSGGANSPFPSFYIPVVLLAALLFRIKGAIYTAIASILLFGSIVLLHYSKLSCCGFVPESLAPASISMSRTFYTLAVYSVTFLFSAISAGIAVDKWQETEAGLKNLANRFRRFRFMHELILEHVPSGVILCDQSGNVLYANRAAAFILEINRKELVGRDMRSIIPQLSDVIRKYGLGEHEVLRREFLYKSPLGDASKIIGCSVCGVEEDGFPDAFVLVFQDITSLKKMEEEKRALEDFKLVAKATVEIAHNIKNPLGAISGAAQMLGDNISSLKYSAGGTVNDLCARLASIIQRESERLNDSVRLLMHMSRSAFKEPAPDVIDVSEEVSRILSLFEQYYRRRGEYRIGVDLAKGCRILIDPGDFEIIMWNLLENSCDAMPEGGEIFVSVKIGDDDPNSVEILVKDTGPGVDPNIRSRIFEPFVSTKTDGSGLGLSIVNNLVKKAGGRIELLNSSEGAAFRIVFSRHE
ncbi:MAG: PAS domain S-box protein [Deltaproteobacteria bacterium]|nr:PAS domain S-box protein [Deltaproteobacteria bacterium]MBW2068121.1 PAS domain S-box protein [Deltaproteobacteria bacterium]